MAEREAKIAENEVVTNAVKKAILLQNRITMADVKKWRLENTNKEKPQVLQLLGWEQTKGQVPSGSALPPGS